MRSLFFAVSIFVLFTSACFAKTDVKKELNKGNLLYNKGAFQQALKQYEQALLSSPDSDIVNYNLAAALYKTEAYRAAADHFEKSLVSEDASLEQKASYNIGNAKYKYGIGYEDMDLPKAIDLLEQSLKHYQRALELEPEDEDARYNYEFVKKELQRLQKKLEQQQKQQQKQEQQKQQQQDRNQQQQKQQESQQQEQQKQQKQPQQQQPKQGAEQQKSQEEKEQAQNQSPQEHRENEQSPSQPAPGKTPQQMSEQEAEMLLDNYRQEEEPKGLYKEKMPTRGTPQVLKDW